MRLKAFVAALLFSIFGDAGFAGGAAKHVIVIVWDGMRPDFVSETNTPVLWELAQRGVTFMNHHAVFPSSTEVNGAALGTGAYPEHDGIRGNKEYRPEIDPENFVHTEEFRAVRRGDLQLGGHYVALPTLVELVREAGGRTAVAGAKAVVLLLDRMARTNFDSGAILFAGQTEPPSLAATLRSRYGEFPASETNTPSRNDWTTLALVDSLWADGVPALSLLWMNEPDRTQHLTGPGSPPSLAAIHHNDEDLGRVLRALDARGERETTDVLVVSDHGFSTVARQVNLTEDLVAAGFHASADAFTAPPKPGDVLVVRNSGSSFLYVVQHQEQVIADLVKFLQSWTNSGVIFTRETRPGTFALSQVGMDGSAAPDIVVSLRWSDGRSATGTPGLIASDSADYPPGHGTHVTLSSFDMHNTLIAAGPDFRVGVRDTLASGNVDVAPTVLWILAVKVPDRMDGRVLSEALTCAGPPIKSFELRHLDANTPAWRQYLNVTEVNGVEYYDEGNGEQTQATPGK